MLLSNLPYYLRQYLSFMAIRVYPVESFDKIQGLIALVRNLVVIKSQCPPILFKDNLKINLEEIKAETLISSIFSEFGLLYLIDAIYDIFNCRIEIFEPFSTLTLKKLAEKI